LFGTRIFRLASAAGAVAVMALGLTAAPASAATAEAGAIAVNVHLDPYPCNGPQMAASGNLTKATNPYGNDCTVTPSTIASVAAGTAGTGLGLVSFSGPTYYDEPCPGPIQGGAWGNVNVGGQSASFEWYRVGLTAVITLFDGGTGSVPTGGGAAVFAPTGPVPPGGCAPAGSAGTLNASILSVAVDS
jgi:hypothetical protein